MSAPADSTPRVTVDTMNDDTHALAAVLGGRGVPMLRPRTNGTASVNPSRPPLSPTNGDRR